MDLDQDTVTFLDQATVYLQINALGPNWQREFVDCMALSKRTAEKKASFKRGFAKAVLGRIPAAEYEKRTGWDFDTQQEYLAHFRELWERNYPEESPEDYVAQGDE